MKITKNKNVLSEKLSDSTFILNNDTGIYIELNETAGDLWNSFKETTSSNDLEQFLIKEYGIDINVAKQDVALFIKECITNKLFL